MRSGYPVAPDWIAPVGISLPALILSIFKKGPCAAKSAVSLRELSASKIRKWYAVAATMPCVRIEQPSYLGGRQPALCALSACYS